MIDEDVSRLLAHYQSAVTEEPRSDLDQIILRAVSRRVVRVRAIRQSAVVLALAALVIWPLWHLNVVRARRATDASGYGRQEGATRYYLLKMASIQYTGPGSMEQGQ